MATYTGIGRSLWLAAAVLTLGSMNQSVHAWTLWDLFDPDPGFGLKIAGTYLRVGEHSAQIMQIGADGSLTFTLSDQYGGGLLNAP